ncbi:MAG: hypothetical protein V4615_01445, partial [Bacteroidota bacterium]
MRNFILIRIVLLILLIVPMVISAFAQAETQNPNSAAGMFWKVQGNTGTTAPTFLSPANNNFIGTIDQTDVSFVTNSNERMRIASGGNIGIGNLPNVNSLVYLYSDLKGVDTSALYAFVAGNANGKSWAVNDVAAGIKAYSYWGNPYSAAIAGYSYQDYAGSAAVVGARYDSIGAGFLAYYDGATRWGVYTPLYVPAYVGGNLRFDQALMPNNNPGVAGQVLTSAGPSVPPVWAAGGGGGSGWLLTGNAGVLSTNFMGSTNDADVIFKRNSIEALRIDTGGALLATGDSATGVTPISGKGTRMMWIPQKAAFRAGYVNGTQWDNANIGINSFAQGKNNTASGQSSFATGESNIVSGTGSVAMGSGNTVTSLSSGMAFGFLNNVSGSYSLAFGQSNNQSRSYSLLGGLGCLALGDYSTAIGYLDSVGYGSAAFGRANGAIGDYSFAVGLSNRATQPYSVAMGWLNRVTGQSSFATGESNTVSGAGSVAMGSGNTVTSLSSGM